MIPYLNVITSLLTAILIAQAGAMPVGLLSKRAAWLSSRAYSSGSGGMRSPGYTYQSSSSGGTHSMSTGVLLAIVIPCSLIGGLAVAVFVWHKLRKNKRARKSNPPSTPPPFDNTNASEPTPAQFTLKDASRAEEIETLTDVTEPDKAYQGRAPITGFTSKGKPIYGNEPPAYSN